MARTGYVIECDGWWNGEVCPYGGVMGPFDSKSKAEKAAKGEGWRLISTGEFCGECVAEKRASR